MKGEVTCPDCSAGYRRIELESLKGRAGHYKCLVCDRVLEVFDGSREVAYWPYSHPICIRNGIRHSKDAPRLWSSCVSITPSQQSAACSDRSPGARRRRDYRSYDRQSAARGQRGVQRPATDRRRGQRDCRNGNRPARPARPSPAFRRT